MTHMPVKKIDFGSFEASKDDSSLEDKENLWLSGASFASKCMDGS